MTKREKMMIIMALLLFSVLLVKSLFLDEVKNLNSEEALFKSSIEEVIMNKYGDTFFMKSKILKRRIVKITKLTDSELENIDGYTLAFDYKAKVRTYLFGIVPFSDKTYMKTNEGEKNE